jgi:hypothetical protein
LHQQNTVEWLADALVVDFPNDADLLRISVSGSKPDELAKVVNAVTNAYVGLIATEARNRQLAALEESRKLHAVLQEHVNTYRDRLKSLRSALKIPEAMTRLVAEQQFLDCSRELRRVKLAKVAYQSRLAARKQAAKKSGEELEEEIAVLAEQEKTLQEEVEKLQELFKRLAATPLEAMQLEIDQSVEMLQRICAEEQRMEFESQLKTAPARILQDTVSQISK